MSSRWPIVGAFALLAGLMALCLAVALKIKVEPVAEAKKGPVRTRNLGEGIRLSRHGLYGIDLVSIGRARMRKLRKGPFTIGAINELVLEDVSLTLPEEVWKGAGDKPEGVEKPEGRDPNGRGETAAKRMLTGLGVNPGHIRMGEKMPRFSALAIRNLRVARIFNETNAVPWFAASRAQAARAGLELYEGWSAEGGRTNFWKEALLTVEPKLALLPAPR